MPAPQDYKASLLELMGCPDLASKAWIWHQYDHLIMGNTAIRPQDGDAALVRVPGGHKGLAMTSDCTPRYVQAHPETGGRQAVAEAWRNITAVGARPLAVTDNMNFGNPQKPEIMGQFAGAIMGMAAHIEGKGATVLDQLGMAQKGGAVISHVRVGATPEALHAVRLGAGGANLLLGCDLVVSASPEALAKLEPGASKAIVNTHETITGEFTRHPDLAFPSNTLKLSIEASAGADACDFIEASKIATALMGDSIATNLFMLGYAYQKGLIPIGQDRKSTRLNSSHT